MILEQETFDKFGYLPKDLSYGSKKMVVVNCDYCKQNFDKAKKYLKIDDLVNKDCCYGCRNKKAEEVNLIKYGCKNQFSRKEIREKIGAEHKIRANTQEFKDKIKKTCMEKYGVASPLQDPKVREKIENTMLEKYGVKNASQAKEIQEKKMATNLERYGNEHYLASEEGKRASKEGVFLKYGVENPYQAEEVKEKIRQINIARYGVDHHFKIPEKAMEHGKNILKIKKDAGKLKTYEGKTISELRVDSGYSDSRFRTLIINYGYEEACKMTPKISSLEQITASWLTEMGLEFNKKKLGKCYPDFNIEDKKLIIETSGLLWHSDRYQPNDNYHVEKLEYYRELGYKSLFFWEDEIVEKPEIIKSIIRNKAGLITDKVAARKCEIKEVSTKDGVEFINQNHLMGPGPSSLTYFLTYEGEPVSCLQMKRKKDLDYEISRFCSKLNFSVIGAFSRLLAHFEKTVEHTSILTFIDKRYGEGLYLPELGFKFDSCSRSFNWTNSHKRLHRMKFPGNTGYELGYNKVWDCGQAKYIKIR
jgi:very-short-patch-repair endonuclease